MKFFKNTNFFFNINAIHHSPNIWKSPDEFLPERFDSSSEFYLQPNGLKRSPNAFMAFSMGPRGCPGKSIAL